MQANVPLSVGAKQLLNITLEVGQMNQTVEVFTEASIVQLTSSTICAEVDSNTLREFPLNGRSWTDLAALQPGVNAANPSAKGFDLETEGELLGNVFKVQKCQARAVSNRRLPRHQ